MTVVCFNSAGTRREIRTRETSSESRATREALHVLKRETGDPSWRAASVL